MRVLHVIDHLGHGGAQVLLVNICTARKNNAWHISHEVLTLHGQGVYAERLIQAGVTVRSLSETKYNLFSIVSKLIAHISRADYDILHLHLEASFFLGTLVGALFRRKPIITTVYSLREQYRKGAFLVFPGLKHLTHHYITLWENDDLTSVGIPHKMISVIPIGVDISGADPSRHTEVRHKLCRTYDISLERPLLLSVARLHRNRQIHVLVEAMVEIAAEQPEAVLIMVGDGEEQNALETFVEEHNLERNVIFAGARLDIWDLLPGCDLYLSSSGRCDTGVAAMQAMACERAVVTYTIAPESMSADEQECTCQGVFVQTRDAHALAQATIRLLADRVAAKTLGQRGREVIQTQFSLDRMLECYLELYAGLGQN